MRSSVGSVAHTVPLRKTYKIILLSAGQKASLPGGGTLSYNKFVYKQIYLTDIQLSLRLQVYVFYFKSLKHSAVALKLA